MLHGWLKSQGVCCGNSRTWIPFSCRHLNLDVGGSHFVAHDTLVKPILRLAGYSFARCLAGEERGSLQFYVLTIVCESLRDCIEILLRESHYDGWANPSLHLFLAMNHSGQVGQFRPKITSERWPMARAWWKGFRMAAESGAHGISCHSCPMLISGPSSNRKLAAEIN